MIYYLRALLVFVILFFGAKLAFAQNQQKDTASSNRIIIDRFLSAELLQDKTEEVKKLSGDVLMHQGDAYMFCDTAYLYGENRLVAIGRVVIKQGDSLHIFGDILHYDGSTKIADMTGDEPVLENGRQQLFAKSQMTYNLGTKIANYSNSALLDNGKTQLRSKQGIYDVKADIAHFFKEVIVVDSSFSLKTDSLKFDTKNQIAYFESPTRISQDSSKIYCEGGYYKTDENLALFYDNAQYQKDKQKATADTIRYDGNLKLTSLIGKAIFEEPNKKATADVIRFDGINDLAFLEGHANYESDKQRIKGDSIRYDNKKQIFASRGRSQYNEGALFLDADQMDSFGDTSIASGNVIYKDTSQRVAILTDVFQYQKDTEFFKAFGKKRPVFKSAIETDTLYLSADTLLSKKILRARIDSTKMVLDSSKLINLDSSKLVLDTSKKATLDTIKIKLEPKKKINLDTIKKIKIENVDSILVQKNDTLNTSKSIIIQNDTIPKDTIRYLFAFKDVRIFKKDFQGRCDSLAYNSKDSLFQLYQTPILWTDTITQLTADTINIRLKNNQLHQLDLYKSALIVSTKNESTFDQIAGATIHTYMEKGKIEYLDVIKSSESIYFIQDEQKAYVGPNKSTSDNMKLVFKNDSVSKIKMYGKVSGKISPMKNINPNNFKVTGFKWELEKRVKSIEDLF